MTLTFRGLTFGLILLVASARAAEPISFTVTETAGLRRFGYPVTVALECTQGSLGETANARLVDERGKEIAAQFTKMSAWFDGSVRELDVDFAPSPGPHETQRYRVELGKEPTHPTGKGLAVTETKDEIIVGSTALTHRIRRDGKPLLTSIIFGESEFIGADGIRTTVATGPLEIVKRGPFNVTLKLGNVRLEYVNTKSWVKITQHAEGPRELTMDAHFKLTQSPLMWDFGLGSWLYGTLAKPGQTASLRHRDGAWQVLTAPETIFATAKSFDGCGHLADSERAAAFGIADIQSGHTPGIELTGIELTGDGRVRIAARREELTVYFHLVRQPIPVTAVTSPQAMIAPLKVSP